MAHCKAFVLFAVRGSPSECREVKAVEQVEEPKGFGTFLVPMFWREPNGKQSRGCRLRFALLDLCIVSLLLSFVLIMADKIPDQIQQYIQANLPVMNQLGFGGVMGFCSGMAFRKVGRAVGVVLGLGFMGAQAAAAAGYVDIDWEKVKGDAMKPLDVVSVIRCGQHQCPGVHKMDSHG